MNRAGSFLHHAQALLVASLKLQELVVHLAELVEHALQRGACAGRQLRAASFAQAAHGRRQALDLASVARALAGEERRDDSREPDADRVHRDLGLHQGDEQCRAPYDQQPDELALRKAVHGGAVPAPPLRRRGAEVTFPVALEPSGEKGNSPQAWFGSLGCNAL